jgi:hypothetical protein
MKRGEPRWGSGIRCRKKVIKDLVKGEIDRWNQVTQDGESLGETQESEPGFKQARSQGRIGLEPGKQEWGTRVGTLKIHHRMTKERDPLGGI